MIKLSTILSEIQIRPSIKLEVDRIYNIQGYYSKDKDKWMLFILESIEPENKEEKYTFRVLGIKAGWSMDEDYLQNMIKTGKIRLWPTQ